MNENANSEKIIIRARELGNLINELATFTYPPLPFKNRKKNNGVSQWLL